MKLTKKLASLALVLLMLCAMTTNVFAAGEGSITINSVSDDVTYEIYRLLDLESYDIASGAYSYKVNSAWAGFFATTEALDYVAIDATGYVTWKAAEDDDTVAAFAKLALAWAKELTDPSDPESARISPIKSSKTPGEFVTTGTSGKFSDLDLGYYLVDSTMGALCGLTTTNPNASVNAKNGQPTLEKQVQEDSLIGTSTDGWGTSNTAQIGQTVDFEVTINVHDGAENYVLHDKMSAGLTFDKVVKVQHVIPGSGSSDIHEATLGTHYTVKTTGISDGCTFEVHFTKEFCDLLSTNDKVVIYYQAVLNENAQLGTHPDTNEAWLDFGEGNHTTSDTTETYTFLIDLVKTDSEGNLLDGAEFRIYDAATGGNEIPVVKENATTYRLAKPDETGVAIAVTGGKVCIKGFDNGVYYLEETVTPSGFNKLTARQKFTISDANLEATFNGSDYSEGSGVHVVNKTGTILPSTGGIGTTIFYVTGAALALGAVVLLVTKKRMGAGE